MSVRYLKRELVDSLFVAVQNILAETAILSMKLGETCVEWKIELPSNSIILVQHELKCDENERVQMTPVIDYKTMNENNEMVDDTNIITHHNIVTFDENKENGHLLCNLKEEIPELLVLLKNEELEDKSIEDNQLNACLTGINISTDSLSRSTKNANESVCSSNGRESIAVTASHSHVVSLTEEEKKGNGDEMKKIKSEAVENEKEVHKNKGKAFEQKSEKEQNKSFHRRIKPGKSAKTRKRLTSQHNPVEHKAIRTMKKCFTDEACGNPFTPLHDLTCHQRINTGEKPCQCEICGKSFSRSYNLSRHRRIHTGDKPFHCEICGRSFIQSVHLSCHRRIHTGEKPFQCEICGKSYADSRYLSRHRRLHTVDKPFKCGQCDNSFTNLSNLIYHRRTHMDEKSFNCEICGKTFTSSFHLMLHIGIHVGEKPFTCDVCGRSFSAKCHLLRHQHFHLK